MTRPYKQRDKMHIFEVIHSLHGTNLISLIMSAFIIILGALVELWKAAISYAIPACPPVRPSVRME
jgi:hypothetical protein